MTALATLAASLALAAPAGPAERHAPPLPFKGGVVKIDARLKGAMTPDAWRPGCPVPIRRLRLLRFSHFDFRGNVQSGRLVINRRESREVLGVMRQL